MTVLASTLVVAIVTVAISKERRDVHILEHDDTADATIMLQAAMQEESTKVAQQQGSMQELDEAHTDSNEACQSMATGCKSTDCSSSHTSRVMQMLEPIVEPKIASAFSLEDTTPAAASKSMAKAELDDPPGAGTLKAVLELMIVMIFIDGIRRWHLQKQAAQLQAKADEAAAEQENAVDRAWVEMVKAATAGDVPNFRKVAQDCPGPLVKREDPWGCTALHFAATGGSAEIATDLLNFGSEVDALDACDETALHFAARAGHTGVCEVLLSSRANINAMNVQDMTPLVVAGHAKQEPVCKFLADNGGTAGGMADEDLPPLVVTQIVRKVLGSA